MTARPIRAAPARRRERLALLVPYRDRQRYLDIFLREVPRYLEKVNGISDYTIYVAEQASPDLFNLALSRNVAAGVALGTVASTTSCSTTSTSSRSNVSTTVLDPSTSPGS